MNLKEFIEAGFFSRKKLEEVHAFDIEHQTPQEDSLFLLPTKTLKENILELGLIEKIRGVPERIKPRWKSPVEKAALFMIGEKRNLTLGCMQVTNKRITSSNGRLIYQNACDLEAGFYAETRQGNFVKLAGTIDGRPIWYPDSEWVNTQVPTNFFSSKEPWIKYINYLASVHPDILVRAFSLYFRAGELRLALSVFEKEPEEIRIFESSVNPRYVSGIQFKTADLSIFIAPARYDKYDTYWNLVTN